jgi:hypothetical protein
MVWDTIGHLDGTAKFLASSIQKVFTMDVSCGIRGAGINFLGGGCSGDIRPGWWPENPESPVEKSRGGRNISRKVYHRCAGKVYSIYSMLDAVTVPHLHICIVTLRIGNIEQRNSPPSHQLL